MGLPSMFAGIAAEVTQQLRDFDHTLIQEINVLLKRYAEDLAQHENNPTYQRHKKALNAFLAAEKSAPHETDETIHCLWRLNRRYRLSLEAVNAHLEKTKRLQNETCWDNAEAASKM